MIPCVVLDTETTGFPNNTGGFAGRIIEVGAVVITQDARVVSPISFFVKQPAEHLASWQAKRAMKVHGIPAALVLREGLDANAAAPRLAQWFRKVQLRHGVRHIRAYNQSFDFWFLERDPWNLLDRTGLAFGEDIKATAQRAMKLKTGPSLKAAVAFANKGAGDFPWLSDAHRAEEDARMAAQMAIFFAG
jgi:DNA polymerase III epsilon subunit-like protein